MLPALPMVDLFKCDPDADEIDFWAPTFSWDMIPAAVGCYAFYDAATLEIVYVGSACVGYNSPSNMGLRMRLRFYRGRGKAEKPTSTVQKVREYARTNHLLLRCWVGASPGDCRKYEDDTLRLHKPILNWIGTRDMGLESHRQKRATYARNRLAKAREAGNLAYDPDRIRRCTKCQQTKTCANFKRNASKLYGVIAVCKECRKL